MLEQPQIRERILEAEIIHNKKVRQIDTEQRANNYCGPALGELITGEETDEAMQQMPD